LLNSIERSSLPFGCQKSFKSAFNTDNVQGFSGKELVFFSV
jgi:hypothetical protein